jgi:hypothetical protein
MSDQQVDPGGQPDDPNAQSVNRTKQLGEVKGQGTEAANKLLEEWRRDVRVRARAQQIAAAQDARSDTLIGLSVIILAAIGASSILTASTDPKLAMAAGFIALFAAILAGVQQYMRFGERSGAHRGAAASFSRIGTRIELLTVKGRDPSTKELGDLAVLMQRLDTETPVVSERIYNTARKQVLAGTS